MQLSATSINKYHSGSGQEVCWSEWPQTEKLHRWRPFRRLSIALFEKAGQQYTATGAHTYKKLEFQDSLQRFYDGGEEY